MNNTSDQARPMSDRAQIVLHLRLFFYTSPLYFFFSHPLTAQSFRRCRAASSPHGLLSVQFPPCGPRCSLLISCQGLSPHSAWPGVLCACILGAVAADHLTPGQSGCITLCCVGGRISGPAVDSFGNFRISRITSAPVSGFWSVCAAQIRRDGGFR
jgi:hypothetical protein